jgi:hypothetical protein
MNLYEIGNCNLLLWICGERRSVVSLRVGQMKRWACQRFEQTHPTINFACPERSKLSREPQAYVLDVYPLHEQGLKYGEVKGTTEILFLQGARTCSGRYVILRPRATYSFSKWDKLADKMRTYLNLFARRSTLMVKWKWCKYPWTMCGNPCNDITEKPDLEGPPSYWCMVQFNGPKRVLGLERVGFAWSELEHNIKWYAY